MQSLNPQRRPTSSINTRDAISPTDRGPESDRPEPNPVSSVEPAPQRGRRRSCPKRTPLNRPKRISKKAKNGGRCDYIGSDGKICSHWQAPGSDACYCHFDAYNSRTGVEMPYPRSTKSRSGGWKKKPVIAVMMTRNELWQRGWYDTP